MSFVRVMCAGDSIVMGSPEFHGGWRRPLNNLAPNLQLVGSQCDHATQATWLGVGQHEGYSGNTTAQVLAKVEAQIPIYEPQVVLWMTGTNNVTVGTEDAAEVYSAAVDVLALAGVAHVIVGNVPYRKTTNALYQETLDFRAAMDAQFAGELPAGLHYCDAGGAVNDDSLIYDTVHPRDSGYALMAPVWFAALQAIGIQTQQAGAGARVQLW